MKSHLLACLAFLFAGCAGSQPLPASAQPPVPAQLAASSQVLEPSPLPPAGARTTVFISDLHMGLGRVAQDANGAWTSGAWHPMEDFRWHDQFDAFLTKLEGTAARTGVPIDLIVLGDFLELWQTPWDQRDCVYDALGKVVVPVEADRAGVQRDLSCTGTDALMRAQRVLGAHAPTLKRLRRFAESGDNRLTIVPGNHDAALIYARVADATLAAIGASPQRVRVAAEGYWRSVDGQIFAEHGHFLENDVNRYDVLPASCLGTDGKLASCKRQGVFLRRPWGEQFVQRYYNQFEERYPVIDNLTNELHGVKIAIAEAGAAETLRAVRDGFRFLLLQESTSQFVSMLGPESDRTLGAGGMPGWDLKTIRKKTGDHFLVESLDVNDPLRAAAEQAFAQGELGLSVKDLSDDEIRSVCNARAARREAARREGQPEPVSDCPGTEKLGAIKTAILRTSAQRLSRRVDEVRKALPEAGRPTKDFSLYVYGHTHSEHAVCRPKEAVPGGVNKQDRWNPAVMNTGAWQLLVTPKTFDEMKVASPKKPLAAFTPEELPPCFSTIVVPAYQADPSTKPAPMLFFWSQGATSQDWDLRAFCSKDRGRAAADPCLN